MQTKRHTAVRVSTVLKCTTTPLNKPFSSYHAPPSSPLFILFVLFGDHVATAAVRLWLGRIAGSLVLGAILGGGAAYYTLPRAGTASSSSPSCASGDATSPWWNTPAGGHSESAKGGAEQGFGDRLNKALFAARAGEAAAQQGLLVR